MENHLGGHNNTTWIDEGCLSYLVETFAVASMVDIGCGTGGMKEVAAHLEVDWLGMDGDPSVRQDGVLIYDFTKGCPVQERVQFDLGWSIEFLEHVEEQYMDNYMEVFSRCRHIVCTAAPPGFGGHHHVNEQANDYWIAKFKERGMYYDSAITMAMKKRSTMKRKRKRSTPKSFMELTGMYFRNK